MDFDLQALIVGGNILTGVCSYGLAVLQNRSKEKKSDQDYRQNQEKLLDTMVEKLFARIEELQKQLDSKASWIDQEQAEKAELQTKLALCEAHNERKDRRIGYLLREIEKLSNKAITEELKDERTENRPDADDSYPGGNSEECST